MLEVTHNRNILIEKQEAQILLRQLEEAFIKICAAEMKLGYDIKSNLRYDVKSNLRYDGYSSEYIKKYYKQMWELFCILGGSHA